MIGKQTIDKTMKIDVVTLFPKMVEQVSQFGILNKAIEKNICSIQCWNPRDYTTDQYKTVDDRPYGGGPGMVMMAEPLAKAIQAARARHSIRPKAVYLSPQGDKLTQAKLEQNSRLDAFILVCGRYEGVDERLLDTEIDEQWSIGDYVLAGGELPALVVIEALVRLLPGALGNDESPKWDSFSDGLLDCPHYTRPKEYRELAVPEVLLSGNHSEIALWRLKQSLGRTDKYRPDLLESKELTEQERILLDEYDKETGDQ